MNKNAPKKTAVAGQPHWVAQNPFDKWFLPFLFVAIGCVIAWACWRH
jgi:hypothetical protein